MSNIHVPNIVPDIFLVDDPVSSSKSILSKQLLEYLPHENVTFDYSNNRIMRFNISSNTDVMIGPESYMTFNFKITQGAGDNYKLDTGGCHALFRSIEVRALASGMLIQRYNYYNRNYAIVSNLTQTKGYVKTQGSQFLDEVSDRDGQFKKLTFEVSIVAGVITSTVAGSFLPFLDENFLYVIQNDGRISAHSVTVKNGNSITVAAIQGGGALVNFGPGYINAYMGPYTRTFNAPVGDDYLPVSKYAYVEAGVKVSLSPMISLLDHNIPMFLMKGGVELVFELEDPKVCLFDPNSTGNPEYSITTPRFYGMMVNPHPDIVAEYANQWRSDKGLMFRIPSFQARRKTLDTSSNVNINLPFGVRSAMQGYMIQQDPAIANGNNKYRSLSLWQAGKLTRAQVKVGSNEFPHRELIETGLGSYFEMYKQTLMAAGQDEMIMYGELRLDPNKYCVSAQLNNVQGVNYNSVNDSRGFVLGFDFARLKGRGDGLTGIDLSTVPLEISLERLDDFESPVLGDIDGNVLVSNRAQSPVVYFFVYHDAYLKISADQMSVLN